MRKKDGMLLAKVDAFFREFSFLERYLKESEVKEIPKVQRVDLALLDRIPWTSNWEEKKYGHCSTKRYLLLDGEGNELCEVRQSCFRNLPFRFFDPRTWVAEEILGDTIDSAIITCLDAANRNNIVFILEINVLFWGRSDAENKEDPWKNIIVHKVPTGIRFLDWNFKMKEMLHQELKKEINVLDKVE